MTHTMHLLHAAARNVDSHSRASRSADVVEASCACRVALASAASQVSGSRYIQAHGYSRSAWGRLSVQATVSGAHIN